MVLRWTAEEPRQVTREIAELRKQVHALRLLALRVSAVVAVALVAVGSALPAWVEEREDESHTYRVLTVGFQQISDPGGGFGVAVRTVLVGLLAALLFLCLVLINSVAAGQGRASGVRPPGFRDAPQRCMRSTAAGLMVPGK